MSSFGFYLQVARKLLKGENSSFSRPIVRLSVVGVALGIVVMIVSIAVTTGYKQVIRDKVVAMGSHIRISNYDMNYSFEPVPFDKNQTFVEEIKAMPEVKSLQCFSTKSGVIKTDDQVEGVVLKGIDQVGMKNKLSEQRCREIYEEVKSNCGDLLLCKIKES